MMVRMTMPTLDQATVLISIVALSVSVFVLFVMIKELQRSRTHDRLSVLPIPEISGENFDQQLSVSIWNYGNGPLLVRSVEVFNLKTDECSPTLWDAMDKLKDPVSFTYTAINLDGRSILPGARIQLVRVESDDVEQDYEDPLLLAAIQECRENLANMVIDVRYTDIYENDHFETYSKELTLFSHERYD